MDSLLFKRFKSIHKMYLSTCHYGSKYHWRIKVLFTLKVLHSYDKLSVLRLSFVFNMYAVKKQLFERVLQTSLFSYNFNVLYIWDFLLLFLLRHHLFLHILLQCPLVSTYKYSVFFSVVLSVYTREHYFNHVYRNK